MKIKHLFLTAIAAITLAACGSQTSKEEVKEATTEVAQTVKVAVVGSAAHELWDYVAEKAKKENINIEVVEMNDYVLPNTALEEGSVQMNAFQHRAYLAQWNKDKGSDLKEIGTTSSINRSMAQDAGLKIEDNIFTEANHLDTIPKDRYNIIVVNGKDADNPVYKKIVELYQTDDVAKKMDEIGPGQYFPVWKSEK